MRNPKRRDVDKAQLLAAEKYVDGLPVEQRVSLLAELEKRERILLARQFSEEGFAAFFEYMHGSPLHREGRKWAANVFKALHGLRKLLQECFRGSGKSTVLTKMFVAFYIGHFPETTNAIIRVNGSKANESTLAVADIIANDPRFKEVFPHVVPVEGKWGEEKGYTVKRDDVSESEWTDICRQSSRPTGATLIGFGYDSGSIQGFRTNGLLIVDDIHVKENTRSPRQMEDVKDFVKYQLLKIPAPGQGLEAWNFTPWTDNDAYAERKATNLYIYSRSPIMEKTTADDPDGVLWPDQIEWPIEVTSSDIDIDLTRQKFPFAGSYWKLGWPERWGISEIALEYINGGPLAFARELMLDLEATKGRLLKRDWLHWMDYDLIDDSWPVIGGYDYASVSDKLKHKDRDYASLARGRAIPGGGIVLFGGRFGHYTKSESLDNIRQHFETYPNTVQMKVEAIGKGEEFYNDAMVLKDMSGKYYPLSKIESHGKSSKAERFEDYLAPRFASSRIWVATKTKDTKKRVSEEDEAFISEFENEWLSFPNGRYDDVIDAVYMMAVAGEGFTPTKAERSFKRKVEKNPFIGLRI